MLIFTVSFYLEGDTTLINGVWGDTQTGFYFSVHPPNKRGDVEYTLRKGKSDDVDWGTKPTLNHRVRNCEERSDKLGMR